MGNLTNPAQWAAQERLRFIERSAFWRGIVQRQDLQAVYGVSPAQASSDLQKYLELNPGALVYSLNRKRYEGAPAMLCVLHDPRLEEALALFLPAGEMPAELVVKNFAPAANTFAGARIAGVTLPQREARPAAQRAVFQAVLHQRRVRVHYHSLTGKKAGWRWIAPHAFGHDGYRWHVRAWCETNEAWRDFVLGRIKDAEAPEAEAQRDPAEDAEWQTPVELVLMPNPALTADQQEAVRLDYNLKGGKLRFTVRRAMLDYTLAHLRLPLSSGKELPPHLVPAE